MKKFFKIILWSIIIIVLLAVLILGYFGFVPGLSTLFGSNSPRDLGIPHTEEDLMSGQQKLGQTFVAPSANPYNQVRSAAASPVDAKLSQEEYAAHVERVHPISDVQIRFEGSTFEMSGRIDKDRISTFVRTLGITETEVTEKEIIDAVNKYLPVNPVFYIAGSGETKNNAVSFDLSKAEMGRLPVDTSLASDALEGYIELIIDQIPALSADSVTVQNGEMLYQGTAPENLPHY